MFPTNVPLMSRTDAIVWARASVLAETSVMSPRKLLIFVIYKTKCFLHQSILKICLFNSENRRSIGVCWVRAEAEHGGGGEHYEVWAHTLWLTTFSRPMSEHRMPHHRVFSSVGLIVCGVGGTRRAAVCISRCHRQSPLSGRLRYKDVHRSGNTRSAAFQK